MSAAPPQIDLDVLAAARTVIADRYSGDSALDELSRSRRRRVR